MTVSQGTLSHVFPGANTPQGFYSLYDHIARIDANKIFVIKGGPGVGKSTFMKRLADDLLQRGYDVEYHHCSADNNSIDAIYIPAGDIALLDGTAPHVVDPKHPGAVDEILHLGDFWNEAAMRAPANKEAILRHTRGCNFRFKRANDALKAAKAAFEEWKAYYTDGLDTARVSACSEDLIAEMLKERLPKAGKARRLFASAITYDGPKVWLSSLFDGAAKRYIIKGEPGTGKSFIVGRLVDAALARGYDLDLFHCPMYPEQVDHLRIKDLNVAVITSAWPHEYAPREGDVVIDTTAFVDQAKVSAYAAEISAAKAAFESAIAREVHHLGLAKKIHDELEKSYVPHMDFAAIEGLRQKTLQRILGLIAERQVETAAD
jgi:molybdopterin-guanine dinucleotide biosynthesis protein